MTKSLKNVKNEKCPLKELEYGEKTENHGTLAEDADMQKRWKYFLKTIKQTALG